MKVICISGKAGSGKDTLAKYMTELLEERGKAVGVIHFADLLKFICTTYFGWDGKKDENGRALLQGVGTDIIREREPNYWVSFVKSLLRFFPEKWEYVLIPDARFPNEIEALKGRYDVTHIRVTRPGEDNGLSDDCKMHTSETALDDYPCDIEVNNAGAPSDLRDYASQILQFLGVDEANAAPGVIFHTEDKGNRVRVHPVNFGMFPWFF